MASNYEKLPVFQEHAEHLAQATGLDWLRFGIVYTREADQSRLLALSVELNSQQGPRDTLHAGVVHAERASAPRSELPSLIAQLMSGRLERLGPLEFVPPVLLSRGTAELNIYYFQERHLDDRMAIVVDGRPQGGFSDIQPRLAELDREIVKASNFNVAGLDRLVAAYTKLTFDPNGGHDVLRLTAPWPIHQLSAQRAGKRVRLDLYANADFDPQRLAINVESPEGDRRLEPKQIEWQPTEPTHDRVMFRGFLTPGVWASAVNVFLAPLPSVSLSADVQNDPGTRAAPYHREQSVALRSTSEGSRLLAIEAKGFRSLRDVKLELDPPLTVLVGPNQAGKTSVLDAIGVVAEGARGELEAAVGRRRGGFEALSFKSGRESVEKIELAATVALGSHRFRYGFVLRPVGTTGFTVESEVLETDRGGRWMPLVQFDDGRGKIGSTKDVYVAQMSELALNQVADPGGRGPWSDVRAALASIAVYPGFNATPPGVAVEANTMRGPSALDDHGQLTPRGENLSAALAMMKKTSPAAWQRLFELTHLVFPDLKELDFRRDLVGNSLLLWHGESGDFEASTLSAGTLNFLATLCALYQEGTSAIGLDEPEQHLHPDALIRIFGAAQSVSAMRPVVIATQSTYLLELLSETPQSLVIARRGPAGTELIRPGEEDLREWLKEFSLGQIRTDLENWVAK